MTSSLEATAVVAALAMAPAAPTVRLTLRLQLQQLLPPPLVTLPLPLPLLDSPLPILLQQQISGAVAAMASLVRMVVANKGRQCLDSGRQNAPRVWQSAHTRRHDDRRSVASRRSR